MSGLRNEVPTGVSHTLELMAIIHGTFREVLKTEISGGGCLPDGQEPSLVLYQTARDTINQHTSRLPVFVQRGKVK